MTSATKRKEGGVGETKHERISDFVATEEGTPDTRIKRWKDTTPSGVSHETLDLVDNGFADNTQVCTVPPGHSFMMDGNHNNSTDSRFSQVGFVPLENIVGKAQIIFFSMYNGERAWQFWRWPFAVRWNRLFTIVRCAAGSKTVPRTKIGSVTVSPTRRCGRGR